MSVNNIAVSKRYNDGRYKECNSTWHVEDSPWKAQQIDKIISRNGLRLATVAEVGCGAGEILRQLSLKKRYSDTKFIGYEVSDDAFSFCMARQSESVSYLLKDVLQEDIYFDAMLCIDVFEHIENYMGFLDRLRTKARYKIFHVPLDLSLSALLTGKLIENRASIGHLHYFTPDTAFATLEDCGYNILDYMYTPSFAGLPQKTVKATLAKLPRRLLYRVSPKLMSTLIGGCSIMVLTE
jgi:hypothetical protein